MDEKNIVAVEAISEPPKQLEENKGLSFLGLPPKELVAQATELANVLSDVIKQKNLTQKIGLKDHVKIEGWSTLGALLGVLPSEKYVKELTDGSFEAGVELFNIKTGALISTASAVCGVDEKTWAQRPKSARRSMAVTRATAKAYRLSFSWIIALAGYETTPAEEIEDKIQEKPQTVVGTASTLINKMNERKQP